MTPPVRPETDHLAVIAAMRKQGANDNDVEAYLHQIGATPVKDEAAPSQIHRLAQRPGGMARLKANVAEQNAADRPSVMANVQGAVDAGLQEIPGAERAMTIARATVHGDPYAKALEELRTSEAEAPGIATIPARLAAMAVPGAGLERLGTTAAKGGMLLGGALPALSADEQPWEERATRTAVGTGLGGLFGKALESLSTVARSKAADTGGAQALDRRAVIRTADAPAYRTAEAEAAGTAATPELKAAMTAPKIAPFVKTARSLEAMQGQDEGRIAMEAYKLMGDEEAQLAVRKAEGRADAGDQALARDLGALKAHLRFGIKSVSPSFEEAVAQHAKLAGEADARAEGADATKRLLSGAKVAGQKEEFKSPEAFEKLAQAMTEGEKAAATGGVLGRTKEYMKLSPNPLTGFGVGKSLVKAAQSGRMLRATDDPFQKLMDLLGGTAGGQIGGRLVSP